MIDFKNCFNDNIASFSFDENECCYSYYTYEEICKLYNIDEVYVKKGVDGLFIYTDTDIISYFYTKSFIKVDFSKCYNHIFISDIIYNKFKNKIFSNYSYTDTLYYKSKDSKGLYNENMVVDGKYTIWHYLTLNSRKCANNSKDYKYKLDEIKVSGNKPSLLLHSCCGPCSSYVLNYLHDYFDITVFYDNSNIYPLEEYVHRLETQKKIISSLGYDDIKLVIGNYDHQKYLSYLGEEVESGEHSHRCYLCYKMRMEEAALYAKGKFDYFTTTISISPHKNSEWINEIGVMLEKSIGTNFLYSNFKVNDGYLKSIELSKKYNLYRQDYCGCEKSIKNKNN